MKKNALIIPVILFLSLLGCQKTELEDLSQEVSNLQDSIGVIINQHQHLLDSISTIIYGMNEEDFDLKAYKMGQIYSLFDAMARQPEASDILIESTGMLYSDISELLPISDEAVVERGMARGVSFGSLFEAVARQPEAFGVLDSAAMIFLGVYDPGYISDEMLEVTRACSMTSLNESIARQPAADSLFNILCMKYLDFEIQGSFSD